MEIAEQHSRLGACDDEDDEDEEQKSKHVVSLTRPNRIQYEKQLDKDATERQDSAHYNSGCWFRVQTLIRHLARDLVRPNRVLNWLQIHHPLAKSDHRLFTQSSMTDPLAESEEGADKGERH